MAVYSIRDIEQLTGIPAHNLRAWEKRYGLVTPRRTDHNVRFYNDDDLRELTGISLLRREGMPISRIAAMSAEERQLEVAAHSPLGPPPGNRMDALTLATAELDAFRFGRIIDSHIEQRGLEDTFLAVIHPFLERLNVLYFTGTAKGVHESFVGAILRQKVLAATNALPQEPADPTASTFGLYLPRGERQELSLLFIQYLLRKRGRRVLYLGADVNEIDLGTAAKAGRLKYLLTVFSTASTAEPVELHVDRVLAACPQSTLLLVGDRAIASRLPRHERLRCFRGLSDLTAFAESGGALQRG